MSALLWVLLMLGPLQEAAVGEVDPAPTPSESDYYALHTVPVPADIVLEVGGLLPREDGSLLVCTRRGDVFHIAGAAGETPVFTRWADGLQEPLGLLADGESVLVTQRGELTRLTDRDGDLRVDSYETVTDDWDLSGSYHEYAFGPARDPDGNLWITLNIPFGPQPFGTVDWRGWAMRLTPEGELQPVCGGLRSPAGVEASPWGDVFYTDNQGEWNGASKLAHLVPGDFHGHPLGIDSAHRPESWVEHPGELPDGLLMPTAVKRVPGFTLPAVWFPYDVTGRSPSGMAWDTTGGAFGPFDGQLFVGDQYGANILRVFLEQVDGVWQGACFRFREGLQSGLIRVAFDEEGGLWAGMSDRGWSSLGPDPWGLQRVTWTGETPFEIQRLEAVPHGFRLTFTAPVDESSVVAPDAWALRRFTYVLHSDYGSPEVDDWPLQVTAYDLSPDRRVLELTVPGLREGYVHELLAPGLRDTDGRPLLHEEAWYTLQRLPGGAPPTRVVFVTGSTEDDDLRATRALADELARDLSWDTALVDAGAHVDAEEDAQPATSHLPDALQDALRDADLVVLDTGDLRVSADALDVLLAYVDSGRPLVVWRARTPDLAVGTITTPEVEETLEGFDEDVLGLLEDETFTGDCTSVLVTVGEDGVAQPTLWTRVRGGARMLVSPLGAAALLASASGRDTLRAGVLWTLDEGPPLDGESGEGGQPDSDD